MMSLSKEQFLTFRKSQCLVWSLVFVSMVTSQSLRKQRNITAGVEGWGFFFLVLAKGQYLKL